MKAALSLAGKHEFTVSAADRNNFDNTVRGMNFISEHDGRHEVAKLALIISQDLTSLLAHYPDTRRGKENAPPSRLPGTEEGNTKGQESP